MKNKPISVPLSRLKKSMNFKPRHNDSKIHNAQVQAREMSTTKMTVTSPRLSISYVSRFKVKRCNLFK